MANPAQIRVARHADNDILMHFIISILLLLAPISYGIDSVTVGDVTYEQIKLKKEYPSSLFIEHSGGTAFIEKSKLAEEQISSITSGKSPSNDAAEANSFQDSPPAAAEPSKAPLHKDIEIHAHENAMSAVTLRGKAVYMRVFTRLDNDGKTVSIFQRANTLPVGGGATISRSDVGQLVAHLKKFLEWEQTSTRERLDNIRKPIGEVGAYNVAFEKKGMANPFGGMSESKSLCEIWRRDRPTSERLRLEKVDSVYLVSMLDNLAEIENASAANEASIRTMQDKADKLLQ